MKENKVLLTNEDGLHARAAALFVRVANRFSSEISLRARDEVVNGKSIIGIMSLGAFSGEEVTIIAEGADEVEATEALVSLIENNFKNV